MIIPIGIDLAEAVAGLLPRRLDRAGAGTAEQAGSIEERTGMAEIDFRTTSLAELARSVRAKEVSARELTQAALDRIERLNPHLQRLRRGRRRAGPPRGRRHRRPHRRRRRPRPAGRHPHRRQGPPERHRLHHDLWIGAPRRRPAGHRRRPLRRPHAGGRMRRRRQDQHARVRLDGEHDQRHLRPLAEPVRHIEGTGRLVGRRIGGRSGRRHGPARHRLRRRRLHPDPLGLLRPLRDEAQPRPRPRRRAQPPGWIDLSTNGPMARRIADVARALDVAVGPDPTDLRALPRPEASWLAALEDPHVPVRIAYAPTLGYATVDAEVAAACERAVGVLESLGADVVVLDSVFDADPVGDFLTFTGACTLRALRPLMDHPRWDGGPSRPAPLRRRRPVDHRRAAATGPRPLPPHEPAARRAVPHGPHPGDADVFGRRPVRRRHDAARSTGRRRPTGSSSPIRST